MARKKGQPADDTSSAPESGTVRDDTSGNQPSQRDQGASPTRPIPDHKGNPDGRGQDDPSYAGKEP